MVTLAAPDVTWINTDSDAGTYLWSTKNLGLSHPTGAPAYNLIGHVLTLKADSLQAQAQILALFSAIASAFTALYLYLITRRFLAPAIFIASALVISQSTIIETYALTTLIMVTLYYHRDQKWTFLAWALLGVGVHHLVAFAFIPLVVYRYKTQGWAVKTDALVLLGVLWYAYFWFAVRPDTIWATVPWNQYFFSQGFLIGGLAPDSMETVTRARDLSFILLGSLGLSIFLATRVKNPLLIVLIICPIIYYATNLAPQTYVYMIPSMAFIALAVSQIDWSKTVRILLWAQVSVFLVLNLFTYDIGNNLDPSPTSARQYLTQLEMLPEGSIVYANRRGWETVLSWNVPKVDVFGVGYELVNRDITPTHISLSTQPERYNSIIVDCPIFPSCHNRWRGVDRLEFPNPYD